MTNPTKARVAPPNADFVMGIEQECMTAVEGTDDRQAITRASQRFLTILRDLAPSVPCVSDGLFNAYGRVYLDCGGHLELASMESCSPYRLALFSERQQRLAAQAVAKLAAEGIPLILANNNHSGVLTDDTSTWGTHENFTVECHPTDTEFGQLILPFLVTRFYAGAGAIQPSTGNFLAGVRPLFMELARGGKTTERRAIHSTARDENHMGATSERFRYHLLVADGHRSQFNLALQLGATALVLKTIFFDDKLRRDLEKLRRLPRHGSWVKTFKEFNVLAAPGDAPRVLPIVLDVQRAYLAGARRTVEALDETAPEWTHRLLSDWENTLDALDRDDVDWLAARLDAFTKHRFYSAVLAERGHKRGDVVGNRELISELTILDQSYHEFCNPQSVFARLEGAGLLAHRVGELILPGEETEPFVPETQTRARARARIIKENAGRVDLVVDWSWVWDRKSGERKQLFDPFAKEYEPWQRTPEWLEDIEF